MENLAQEFHVSGIHCPVCESKLRDFLLKHEGVSRVEISLGGARIFIWSDKSFAAEELNQYLAQDGSYHVEPVYE